MSKKSIISIDAFKKIFNDRDFNPPSAEIDFDKEFDEAIEMLRPILLKHAKPDDFFSL